MALWDNTRPKLLNMRGSNKTPFEDERVVRIDRPSQFGNPFPVGSTLSFAFVAERLRENRLFSPEGVSVVNWIKVAFPVLASHCASGVPLDRAGAIMCFREYWVHARAEGVFPDSLVLGLRGKLLACWCYPKPCHGDVLVEDFIKTSRGG